MPRSFRVYSKKRGDRFTGSKALGSVGEALFFACIFGIGATVLFLLLKKLIVPEWRANHSFVETTCVVRQTRCAVKDGPNGATYVPEVLVRYSVNGQRMEFWTYDIASVRNVRLIRSADPAAAQAIAAQYQVGRQYPCWYDPLDPSVVVVVRGYTWWLWSLILLPLAFLGIGGVGLVYSLLDWGKSTERRAATMLRGLNLDKLDPQNRGRQALPYLPKAENLTNSPGVTLAYRLPIHTSQGWRLFGATVVSLIWNGIVAMFLVRVLSGESSENRLLMVLFLIPFGLAGLALVGYLMRQLIVTTAIGTTHIEIAEHPLLPGGRYEALVGQAGHLHVQLLQVDLVCDEEVSYHQGTDIRIERRRVYQQPVFRRQNFEIQPGLPFEERFELAVPDQAMHSFQGDYNEIQWKLLVCGRAEHRTPYERVFPVIVYPRPRVESQA